MSPAARPGGFEGDLEALSVVEIVQTLSLGGKTARLLVSSNARHGEVWFDEGEMTHAAAGSLFGDLAVYAMIEWTSGRFFVEYGVTSEARSITQDATYLVLEGLRRFDERSANRSPEAELAEVPAVREADVPRSGSRPLVLGMLAVGLAAGVIITSALRDWKSPSATDAVASVSAVEVPAPSVAAEPSPKPSPAKRSTTSRPSSKKKANVAAPSPVVAPESPATEEPVPVGAPPAP